MNTNEHGDSLDAIVERLRAAVRRRYGEATDIDNVSQATLGGSNRTILFDLVEPQGRRRLVSRQETYTLEHTPFLPTDKQYRVLLVAFAHGLPVPEPMFEFLPDDGLGRGYVVACIEGETLPKRLLNDSAFTGARRVFVQQAGEILARLHAIDPRAADVLDDVLDSHDPLAAQRVHYDKYGESHPALEFAFRWLEQHRPPVRRRSLLHGDFRNGNMIVGSDGIRAVLDWECAHIGDPLSDLGWLCTRAWRFGRDDKPVAGIGVRADLYAAYEAAGGEQVDLEAVRWWEIFGSLRWALFNIMQVYGHMTGARRSPVFAACGRNTCLIEYDLLMTIAGRLD